MQLAIGIVLLAALVWAWGRNWEMRSPYPPVRMHGNAQRAAVDQVTPDSRAQVVRTVSRYR